MTRLTDTLKSSMLALYYDDEEIYEALLQVDWTQLNSKYSQELFSRIDVNTFYYVDEFLHSDEYMLYANAVNQAAMSVTQDLANLIKLAKVQGSEH